MTHDFVTTFMEYDLVQPRCGGWGFNFLNHILGEEWTTNNAKYILLVSDVHHWRREIAQNIESQESRRDGSKPPVATSLTD